MQKTPNSDWLTKKKGALLTLPLRDLNHTALLAGQLLRDSSGVWTWRTLHQGTDGRSFGDLVPRMQETLRFLVPKIEIIDSSTIIVLAKGETVPIQKQNGAKLRKIFVGLGWDMMGSTAVDLDASCLLFDAKRNLIEAVFFNRLSNSNGSVRHGGDNLTGEGEGDDEKIFVDLENLPTNVHTLFILVNSYSGPSATDRSSYSGHTFAMIKNAYVRLVNHDSKSSEELVRFQLNGAGSPDHTALLMCKIYLDETQSGERRWLLRAIGYGCKGRMYTDNVKECQKELAGKLPMDAVISSYSRYVPPERSTPVSKQWLEGVDNKVTFLGALVLVLLFIVLYQNL